MNGRIWSAACGAIVCGAAVAVFAQAPTTDASQSTSAKSVTVTGCVQRAEQSPTGTSGVSGSAPASEVKFVLTNAALNPSTSPNAMGTSGAAAAPATAIASEYRLDSSDSKLSAHVGHKVEITGTVEPAAQTEQSPSASAANSPTLKVKTVKMIASSCPAQ